MKLFFDNLQENGLICAHRGARSIAPENTLLALKKAKECGAHCWETDVRMSKDGELVIFHDETLERTTDVTTHKAFRNRQPWYTGQFTANELRELDLGSWFLRDDPFSTIAGGEVGTEERGVICSQKILMLHEILEFTKTHRFPVNLEIKDLSTPPGDVTIVDRIIDMLEETETMDLVLLSSFRHEYLHRARALSQKVAIGVLAEKQHPPNLIQYLDDLSAAAYHPEEDICDLGMVNALRRAGFRVNSWTINDIPRAQEMFAAGVGIITDWPQRFTQSSNR
jgi:glycerophosphoryl diester phosphodiesterase